MPKASADIARVSSDLDQPNHQLERKRDLLRSVVVELQLAIDALTAIHLPKTTITYVGQWRKCADEEKEWIFPCESRYP
jgi:hypothetical protein